MEKENNNTKPEQNDILKEIFGEDKDKSTNLIEQARLDKERNANITEQTKVVKDTSVSENNDTQYDSDSDYGSDISLNIQLFDLNKPEFNNFNTDLSWEEKDYYFRIKFYIKGLDYNESWLDTLSKLLLETDGTPANVDKLIDSNLNHVLKLHREAQLNHLGFIRNKPFLITHADKIPLVSPHVIPISNASNIYD